MKKVSLLMIIILLLSTVSCTVKNQDTKLSGPMVPMKNGGYYTLSQNKNGPVSVYSAVPIPEGFSLGDTLHQRMFVQNGFDVISGRKYWNEFYSKSLKNQSASLIMVQYFESTNTKEDSQSVIYIQKITYTPDQGYTLTSFSDSFRTYHYPYLIQVSGHYPNSDIMSRNYYLVKNPLLTFDKLVWSVLSSNSDDWVESYLVWSEHLSDNKEGVAK